MQDGVRRRAEYQRARQRPRKGDDSEHEYPSNDEQYLYHVFSLFHAVGGEFEHVEHLVEAHEENVIKVFEKLKHGYLRCYAYNIINSGFLVKRYYRSDDLESIMPGIVDCVDTRQSDLMKNKNRHV